MLIRPATASDVEAIEECVVDAYETYVARIGKKPAPMLDDYRELVAMNRVWVGLIKDRLVGLVVMWPESDHLYVDNVAVHSTMRGQGIGALLLDHADGIARRNNRSEVRLYTNETMIENIDYYPRRGFVETHRAEQDGYERVFYRREVR